jgi:AmmeMemoRadiSam system protein B
VSGGRIVTERPPAVAGAFYPADPEELAADVDRLLAGARPVEAAAEPVALVVPHAGYVYSGPVAATAYALLRDRATARVALLGPAHFEPLAGAAVTAADGWRNPLGVVAIDTELRATAVAAGAMVDERAHEPEHAVEVQLPFLQRVLGAGFRALPIAVGVADAAWVADLIAMLLPYGLVVVSTDLSHYQDDATARALDRRTADAVVSRDPERIGRDDACGSFALRGLVELARRDDLLVRLLDLRTSADTAGDPGRVVGYGAFAIERGL